MIEKKRLKMEKKNPIEEARRYVDNAKEILRENGELDTETRLYGDSKYVRMAGDTLWKGVLLILTMHLYMGYDGTKVKDTCDAGFRMATEIIDRCAVMLSA